MFCVEEAQEEGRDERYIYTLPAPLVLLGSIARMGVCCGERDRRRFLGGRSTYPVPRAVVLFKGQ